MTNTTGSPEHDDAVSPAAEVEPTAPESPGAAQPTPTPEAAAATPAEAESTPAEAETAAAEATPAVPAEPETAPAEAEAEPSNAEPAPAEATPTDADPALAEAEAEPAAVVPGEPEAEPANAEPATTDATPGEATPDDPEVAQPAAMPTPADLAAVPAEPAPAAAEPAPAEPAAEAAPAAPAEPEPAAAEAASAEQEPAAAEAAPAEPAPARPTPAPPVPAAADPAPTAATRTSPAPSVPTPSVPTPSVPTPSAPTPSAPAAESTGPAAPTVASNEWGRVDESGEVYVRTAEGERSIGSWQVGKPEEALAFFIRKYEDLAVQVDLLETRLESGAAAPDDTAQGVAKVRAQLAEAHAIGDLAALSTRLDALDARIAERRAERRAARAKALEEARGRKEQIAQQAESIAEGSDWRNGADTLRGLLEEWKSLPRLDRATDDELWRRFSSARTHYTRRRKAHFSELAERRDEARVIKERILAEAEEISGSTDWGTTSRRYRELMSQWKAAGPAPRGVEDSLWKRFRAAQDTFFGARAAQQSQRDDEQQANLAVKEGILASAEALLPITDWKVARQQLRVLQERWEDAGHVPRDAMRSVEGRMRRVEDAIREAEQNEWQQSNPEARARAQATVTQLEASIADLESKAAKAREAGNDRKLREAEEAIEARKSWLVQAQQALEEFTR